MDRTTRRQASGSSQLLLPLHGGASDLRSPHAVFVRERFRLNNAGIRHPGRIEIVRRIGLSLDDARARSGPADAYAGHQGRE